MVLNSLTLQNKTKEGLYKQLDITVDSYNAFIQSDEPILITIRENEIGITSPGYYISNRRDILNSRFKYSRNPYIKFFMDLLIKDEKPHHGFASIQKQAKENNMTERKIEQKDSCFIVTIFASEYQSIYQVPYTIDAIL